MDSKVESIIKYFNVACSLVDGAIEVVELYKPTSPAQIAWRNIWISESTNLLNNKQMLYENITTLQTHAATSDFCSAEWKHAFDKSSNIINKIKQAIEDRKQSITEDRDYPFFNIIEDIIEENEE